MDGAYAVVCVCSKQRIFGSVCAQWTARIVILIYVILSVILVLAAILNTLFTRISMAPGFAAQDHAQARDPNAAQGNAHDMDAIAANLFRKECQGCCEARRPSRPAPRVESSGAIVASQPWIQLTGNFAWCVSCITLAIPARISIG